MKIYVASSWRNDRQPGVIKCLRTLGHEVYDFRNPKEDDYGFHWSDIDREWKSWSRKEYIKALGHPLAEHGLKSDFDAMKWADAFVGVMPFGRSASLEMGWAVGAGKQTALLLSDGEPELMVKMLHTLCPDMDSLIALAQQWADPHGEPLEDEPSCPTCGGDGFAEYNDCPEAWGEDCPSEINHLIVCPNCNGSGLMKDATCC